MKFRLFRFGVSFIWIAASITIVLLYFYYINASLSLKKLISKVNFVNDYQSASDTSKILQDKKQFEIIGKIQNDFDKTRTKTKKVNGMFLYCYEYDEANATINTFNEYQHFDFGAKWIKSKGIWNGNFEKKFENLSKDEQRPPLHVVIMPHSHNDPGWLKTFEGYFQSQTQSILNNVVKKLPDLDEMTFVWTEICFLELWWQKSNDEQRKIFSQLVHDGRIEIMTGGWVMTDEASAHIYEMVDQLIEGHQWLKSNLNVTPKNSWSIDPFGHGSTMPYLLGTIDFDGAIIQRIHYNWKEWLASRQFGDFIWRPSWTAKQSEKHSLLTHNMPFDMYFVDSSCGPHIDKCKPYDFRWFGMINEKEVQQKADQLIQEYSRSASLYPHNVFLAIVGGDFRYDMEYEFGAQYNYKKIIDYVNSNPERYKNAKLQFGTPKDYFRIIKERNKNFPTLVGDFFPYSDIFTNGEPAYWTGYFTTRPFLKIISRELEHNLRNAEILYTFGLNKAQQMSNETIVTGLQKIYTKLVNARRNLGLFQHHDAITGTSKAMVMKNYLDRIYDSLNDTIKIQQLVIEGLIQSKNNNENFLTNTLFRDKSDKIPQNLVITILSESESEIILFNSLAQERIDAVTVHVSKSNIQVLDSDGNSVPYQVNSIFRREENSTDVEEIENEFELLFIAKLPPLSLSTYHIIEITSKSLAKTTIYSGNNDDDIQIENSKFKLFFDKVTGLLQYITALYSSENTLLQIMFGAYNSSCGKSGAYLFKPDEKHPEVQNIFIKDKLSKIIVIDGDVASYVKVFHGKLLTHSVRILKTNTHLDEALYVENNVNMNNDHSNFEMYMRLITSVANGIESEFFTDLNGFQWQKRKRVSKLGVEANYYPITAGAFIQDDGTRVTLLTSHAQGVTSPSEGILEVMLDKRTPNDDQRGMQEGVTDNLETVQKHWISLEFLSNGHKNSKKYHVPTIHASTLSYMLKYPVNIFVNSGGAEDLYRKVEFLKNPLPCDIHLFNLRTLTAVDNGKLPSKSSLMLVHRLSYDCKFFITNGNFYNKKCEESLENFDDLDIFNDIIIDSVQSTSLTGLMQNGRLKTFNDNPIDAMEIRSFNLTFQ